jgi:hypothetical protein
VYRVLFVFPSTGRAQGELTDGAGTPRRFATREEALAHVRHAGYDPDYYDVREADPRPGKEGL